MAAPSSREALALAGRHLSLYQLTIEPETPFAALHAAGKLAVPDAEAALALYEIDAGADERRRACRPTRSPTTRRRARRAATTCSTGAMANTPASGPARTAGSSIGGARHATATERNPERWARRGRGATATAWSKTTPLSRAEQADEMLLMGLRLAEGLDLARLARIGHVRPGQAAIDQLVGLGLLEALADGRRIRATGSGRFVLNELVVRLSAAFEAAGVGRLSAPSSR